VAAVLLVAPGAYLASGFTVVAPGEVVVVRRLGRMLDRPWSPGLHWGWPAPLERRDRVRTREVRRVEIGLADGPGPGDDPSAGEFLTGDLNFLLARAVVQYRVEDPRAYVRNLAGGQAESWVRRLAESSLARQLAGRGIDDVLRAGRAEVALAARDDLADQVDRLGLGLAILAVSVTDARPPVEVAPAFAEAQSARSTRDRRIQDAATYRETTLAAARAEAGSRRDRAHARADRTMMLAEARAERFVALQCEVARDRPLTIRRLYLDALRGLLPRVRRTLVLAPDEPIDLSIFGSEPQAPP
jgi:membrane protease subunit HflK